MRTHAQQYLHTHTHTYQNTIKHAQTFRHVYMQIGKRFFHITVTMVNGGICTAGNGNVNTTLNRPTTTHKSAAGEVQEP